MAVQKPLVFVDNQIQQLPAGDTIDEGSSTKWPIVCDTVDVGETLTIPATYQLILASQLNNNGTIANSGVLYIL